MPKTKTTRRAAAPPKDKARMKVSVYDGTRQLLPKGTEVNIRIRDGNNNELPVRTVKGAQAEFTLRFFNNFGDNYTVVAFARGYSDAGITPVKLSLDFTRQVDLMLLPENPAYNFDDATWEKLEQTHPWLIRLLSADAASSREASTLYHDLFENHEHSLACFLNLTEAMSEIHLSVGSPLEYLKALRWEKAGEKFRYIRPDRFFAWADPALLEQVKLAAAQGEFSREPGPGTFHHGATSSFKQVQFGEANVQLTFHERDQKNIEGTNCIMVEPDIDYFKDPLAHAFFEVLPNTVRGDMTDPRTVYFLRWIAGRQSGVANFAPPYTIVRSN
ncbi:MAG: hypothetical protein L0Z53_20920 [Acidobacteriales bacterium]|nr:hypothetical protein [Terriglobales bacterium]